MATFLYYLLSLSKSIVWSRVSNAAERSSMTKQVRHSFDFQKGRLGEVIFTVITIAVAIY